MPESTAASRGLAAALQNVTLPSQATRESQTRLHPSPPTGRRSTSASLLRDERAVSRTGRPSLVAMSADKSAPPLLLSCSLARARASQSLDQYHPPFPCA